MKVKLTLLIISLLTVLSFSNFNDLYLRNLNTSTYLKSKESLDVSILSLNKKENFWSPYLSLNTGFGGISFDKDGLNKMNFSIKANFLELYGSTIGLTLPFSIDAKDNWKFDSDLKNLSLSFTRSLAKEPEVEMLNAKSNYYNSLYSFNNYKTSIFIKTIKDIFSKYYIINSLKLNKEELQIQKNKYNFETDEDKKESLNIQILQREKIINSYEVQLKSLSEIDESLYESTKKYVGNLVENSKESTIVNRYDLKAIKLSTKAKELQKNNWFLPYLPDMSINISISDINNFNWSISISFDYSIFDRGERLIAINSRKINSNEYSYEEALTTINNNINTLKDSIINSEIDIQISKINIKNALEDYNNKKKLSEKGFISKDDFNLFKVEYELKKLDLEKVNNDMLINKLNLLKEYGYFQNSEVIKVEKID
ncbi:membrane protein [Tepiditoga spiralis]|uniref:Membrane protein n=1 Tax=Tepiditoga spiralis TaxID=2108365 RepID=A0A7G1G6J1_9BACT|nr:TolC family protein [Tepiditoga spiralis]BBE30744.1 membrane protein [Tepiditoga spiralis]